MITFKHSIDMKTKIYKELSKGVFLLAGMAVLGSCSRDFLDQDPLSFYEPKNTYSTESGLQATLAMADRHTRLYWTNFEKNNINVPITTEYMFSELSVYGKTDAGRGLWDNIAGKFTPTNGLDNNDTNHTKYFWDESYNGIKHANTVLSYVDGVTALSEAKKNEYKGRAYFHRAFRYYNLVFQFGDVPLVTKILTVPKRNYRSTKKEAILQMLVQDMEKAVQWVPEQSAMEYYGMVNKGACRQLLTKLYLATGEWKKAEAQADTLINNEGYALMEEAFGDAGVANSGEPKTWNITRNVIWDLHRPENKIISANKECIMSMPNNGDQTHTDFLTMRILGPFWNDAQLKAPDGKQAVINYARNNKNYRDTLDWLRVAGRGIGTVRLTYFAQHALWNVNGIEDTTDLRHNSKVGNWMRMTDFKCNNPGSAYYGKKLSLHDPADGKLLVGDTIRDWFDFPLYKIYLKDAVAEANQGANQFNGATKGSNANWYLYRLAETYLLRAEARFYLGNTAGATSDVNVVRKRAKCSEYYTTVTIGDIANERARELYLEEWRNVELTRISYDLALSGKPDEWGNTYSIETWNKQQGTDAAGGSYWYQRIYHYTPYNHGTIISKVNLNYTMDKKNVFWPIPNDAIQANDKGQLAQNYGYDGYDPSTPVWTDWKDAVADEEKTN